MADTDLMCSADGVATRLRCAGCRTPICPSCFVRTDVGLKCDVCAAPVPAAVHFGERLESRRRRRAIVIGVAAVAGVAAIVGAVAVFSPESEGVLDDTMIDRSVGADAEAVATDPLLATGGLPDGGAWSLTGRLDQASGGVCSRLFVGSQRSGPEGCEPVPTQRPYNRTAAFFLTPTSPDSAAVVYGIVARTVEQVTVTTEDGAPLEAELARGDAPDVRFFVFVTPRPVAVSVRLVAANGATVGGIRLPAFSPTRR